MAMKDICKEGSEEYPNAENMDSGEMFLTRTSAFNFSACSYFGVVHQLYSESWKFVLC